MDDVRLYAACNASNLAYTAEVHWNGEHHIQIFIWGGISSDLRSEITFPIIESDDIPPQMKILNTVIP